jgi:hypothetical protein
MDKFAIFVTQSDFFKRSKTESRVRKKSIPGFFLQILNEIYFSQKNEKV